MAIQAFKSSSAWLMMLTVSAGECFSILRNASWTPSARRKEVRRNAASRNDPRRTKDGEHLGLADDAGVDWSKGFELKELPRAVDAEVDAHHGSSSSRHAEPNERARRKSPCGSCLEPASSPNLLTVEAEPRSHGRHVRLERLLRLLHR